MDKLHFMRGVRITTGLFGLLLLGLDAAAVIVAVSRSTPVAVIPFASASLISFGAIWWAHRFSGERAAIPPFGADKITPHSSDAYPAKAVDWEPLTWPGQRSER